MGVAFDTKKAEPFVTEGTKTFRKVLEDLKKGGDKKFVRETGGNKVLNTVQEKTFNLLPEDLQTFFVNKTNESFTNLFSGGGVVADDKERISRLVLNRVPVDVDKEASALAKKIQTAEDARHRAAPGNEAADKDKKAHEALQVREKNREAEELIKSAYAMVQKDTDLKKVYKNALLFRNVMKSDEIQNLIKEGKDQSMSNKEIVEAIIAILKEKQSAKTAASTTTAAAK